jgi:hypothetical protein
MYLGQELSPDGSSISGVPLTPHLALPGFRLKQPLFQQVRQQSKKRLSYYPTCQIMGRVYVSNPALLSNRYEALIA